MRLGSGVAVCGYGIGQQPLAPVQHLAWELPYAMRAALKKNKIKLKKKTTQNNIQKIIIIAIIIKALSASCH